MTSKQSNNKTSPAKRATAKKPPPKKTLAKKGQTKSSQTKKGQTKRRSAKGSSRTKAGNRTAQANKVETSKAAASRSSSKQGTTRAKRATGAKTTRDIASTSPVTIFDPFDVPTSTVTEPTPATVAAELRQQQQSRPNLPDLMARSITEGLEERSRQAKVEATATRPQTLAAVQATTRERTRVLWAGLTSLWDKLVELFGAPPPDSKRTRD